MGDRRDRPGLAAQAGQEGLQPGSGLPGGLLTTPRVNADITFEFNPDGTRSTFGLQVKNLFNELYNTPIFNNCYGTPVTTGLTNGASPCTFSTAPYAPPDVTAHGSQSYLTYPNLAPISFRLYYQVLI